MQISELQQQGVVFVGGKLFDEAEGRHVSRISPHGIEHVVNLALDDLANAGGMDEQRRGSANLLRPFAGMPILLPRQRPDRTARRWRWRRCLMCILPIIIFPLHRGGMRRSFGSCEIFGRHPNLGLWGAVAVAVRLASAYGPPWLASVWVAYVAGVANSALGHPIVVPAAVAQGATVVRPGCYHGSHLSTGHGCLGCSDRCA
mmetsp:Transcript_7778/g.22545  ORF Transcript_7778/g.22545 Transcript_7778/m.22545 type:complete len:202 (+) Transcript_7778:4432-5037(+)